MLQAPYRCFTPLKADVAALAEVEPDEQESHFAEHWGYEREEFAAVLALSRLWQKRAQEEREHLAKWQPEVPGEITGDTPIENVATGA